MTAWFFELPLLYQLLCVYLLAINIITFFYFGIDKLKAHFKFYRIPEKTLWLLALLGGSPGALLGMKFFRHKTRKSSFQAVFLIILLVQVAGVFLLLQG